VVLPHRDAERQRPACRCSCAVGDRREVRIYLGEI
jgi:hypothetical protein